MKKNRLLKLADLLDGLKNKKGYQFDMRGWGETDNPKKPHSCGTTGCALGIGAMAGIFKRQGLTWDHDFDTFVYRHSRNPDGFRIARELFEIYSEDARYLFSASAYPYCPTEGVVAARAVAQRIRDYVANGGL
jgi:hypothetical protein